MAVEEPIPEVTHHEATHETTQHTHAEHTHQEEAAAEAPSTVISTPAEHNDAVTVAQSTTEQTDPSTVQPVATEETATPEPLSPAITAHVTAAEGEVAAESIASAESQLSTSEDMQSRLTGALAKIDELLATVHDKEAELVLLTSKFSDALVVCVVLCCAMYLRVSVGFVDCVSGAKRRAPGVPGTRVEPVP